MRAADTRFVLKLLARPELRDYVAPGIASKAKLCMKCENVDFFAKNFQIADTFEDLRRDASLCDFCKMRWHLGRNSFSHEVRSILFDLVDSDLRLDRQPVIRFVACHQNTGVCHCPRNGNIIHMPR